MSGSKGVRSIRAARQTLTSSRLANPVRHSWLLALDRLRRAGVADARAGARPLSAWSHGRGGDDEPGRARSAAERDDAGSRCRRRDGSLPGDAGALPLDGRDSDDPSSALGARAAGRAPRVRVPGLRRHVRRRLGPPEGGSVPVRRTRDGSADVAQSGAQARRGWLRLQACPRRCKAAHCRLLARAQRLPRRGCQSRSASSSDRSGSRSRPLR